MNRLDAIQHALGQLNLYAVDVFLQLIEARGPDQVAGDERLQVHESLRQRGWRQAVVTRQLHVRGYRILDLRLVVAVEPRVNRHAGPFRALGIHGDDSFIPDATRFFDAQGMLVLIVLTSAMGLFFERVGLPNPWVLGPLLVTGLLTSNEIVFTTLPTGMTNVGQLLIGWSLGDKFGPAFFRRAPRYLSVVALSNTVNILLAFAFGYAVYLISDIPFPTLVLGTSPGGIAEMAITAKVLMLGAPVVTSFHVVRMVFVLLVTAPLFRVMDRHLRARTERAP